MFALALAFIGTNVDGFLCLAAAFAVDPPRNRVYAIVVAACGFAVLLGISCAVALAIGRIGLGAAWFGLVPAGIGVWRLLRLLFGVKSRGQEDWLSSGPSIFSIVLATGADNVAVYAPLFATRPLSATWIVAAAYMLAWVLGCTVLAYATPNLARVHVLRRNLEPILALLFIVIGITIARS